MNMGVSLLIVLVFSRFDALLSHNSIFSGKM